MVPSILGHRPEITVTIALFKEDLMKMMISERQFREKIKSPYLPMAMLNLWRIALWPLTGWSSFIPSRPEDIVYHFKVWKCSPILELSQARRRRRVRMTTRMGARVTKPTTLFQSKEMALPEKGSISLGSSISHGLWDLNDFFRAF